MTLIIAATSSGIGAAITWGVTRERIATLVQKIRDLQSDLRDRVVWKDACSQCQNKWTGHVDSLTDNIQRIDGKIDRILERLK